ncbi:MAG TPA: glycerol-3-phosphate 1-O-acyltransferase PlsY [Kiloniellales bacterium]|nr:glycerol-3-phosphate 1-O-acyltransferase PlsY [Kiloniellales bacterium]
MPDPISWEYAWPYLASALIGGYLLGSLPFGLLLTRLLGLGDIRKIGSGNIGATNVLRTGRKDVAAATLLLDAGKGALAVLIAKTWGPDMANMAGLGAILGHMFPVWLRFQGGKGVATMLGAYLAIAWPVGLSACALWLVLALVTRYSSVASLGAAAAAAPLGWVLMGDLQLLQLFGFIAVLVWLRHAGNLRRLVKGEESRIGGKG